MIYIFLKKSAKTSPMNLLFVEPHFRESCA
jgi:hypothetical protein